MESTRFDRLTRLFATQASRRSFVRGAVAAIAGTGIAATSSASPAMCDLYAIDFGSNGCVDSGGDFTCSATFDQFAPGSTVLIADAPTCRWGCPPDAYSRCTGSGAERTCGCIARPM